MPKKPFQVGDRVAAYRLSRVDINHVERILGVIDAISGGVVRIATDSGFERFALKSCRRLVKRERRRVWIAPDRLASIPKDGTYHVAATRADYSCNGWIEFVEVKRK